MSKVALIVDDSRLACRVMAKMLGTFGIKSEEVYSAEAGLSYLNQTQPDVIFLDHSMQGMDGLAMLKILKANPVVADIPVIMHTAKEGKFYIKEAMSLGAAEVFSKGLEERHLFKMLIELGLVNRGTQFDDSASRQRNKKKRAEKQSSKVKQPSHTDTKPTLQLFWQQRIEPYLARLRGQQQQELEYRINTQTRKLTREIHLTLEQFEHALVLRMESHADFVASTELVARSMRRKLLMSVGLLLLVMQFGIFWHLWHDDKLSQTLLQSQQEIGLMNKRLSQLGQKINELDINIHKENAEVKITGSADGSLFDRFGSFLADVELVDKNSGVYQGISFNGYHFWVDAKGVIGRAIGDRYYLSNDCYGDVFVDSPAAIIFKGAEHSIWYVDKQAERVAINIGSKQSSDNKCVMLTGDLMMLRHLQPNDSNETGIEQHREMEIRFN